MPESTKNLSPKRMTEVINVTPLSLKKDTLKINFSGHRIQVSGRINSGDSIMSSYVSFYIKDEDGVDIAVNFNLPASPEVSLLRVGDNIVAEGVIRNVSDSMVALDNCVLISTTDKPKIERVIEPKSGMIGIHITEKAKNTQIIDNKFAGLSIGIKDEGENTIAVGNQFLKSFGKSTDAPVIIKNSRVHLGNGNMFEGDKNTTPKQNLLEKYWWGFFIPIVVIILGFMIVEGKIPKLLNSLSITSQNQEARTLDVSVFQLVANTDFRLPLLEIQQKWKNYSGLKTIKEHATISNYGDAGLNRTWVDLVSINSYPDSKQNVTCVFGEEWRQKIRLLGNDGNDKAVTFSGTIAGNLTQGGVPILSECVFNVPD